LFCVGLKYALKSGVNFVYLHAWTQLVSAFDVARTLTLSFLTTLSFFTTVFHFSLVYLYGFMGSFSGTHDMSSRLLRYLLL